MKSTELQNIITYIADMLPAYTDKDWDDKADSLKCDVAFAKCKLNNLVKHLEKENGTSILRQRDTNASIRLASKSDIRCSHNDLRSDRRDK